MKPRDSDWEVVDALLLRAAVGEPAAMSTILRIFEKHERQPKEIKNALESICVHHARLQQASEVAWALWAAKQLEVPLSRDAANAVATVDDDIVALVALDMYASNLLPAPENDFGVWAEHMTAEDLYGDHWLLAYEALQQEWLPAASGLNYLPADPYFGILHQGGIRFYNDSPDVEWSESEYGEDGEFVDIFAIDTEAKDEIVVNTAEQITHLPF